MGMAFSFRYAAHSLVTHESRMLKEVACPPTRNWLCCLATVDTYPDAEWHGTVESISPAAAQQFALLPAQNTSRNWVKVVQRITMRVRIDTTDKNLPPLHRLH
jgi:hypothetical protein